MSAPPSEPNAAPATGAVGRPVRVWLVIGLAVVLAGGGYLAWRWSTDQEPAARAAAQRAADALGQRTIADGAFGTTVGPAEVDDLTATLRGMGTLRPAIEVESVQLVDDQRSATARLRAEWVIHAGKPSWIQDAYLRLARGPGGWTAIWSRDLIASGLQASDRIRALRLAPERGEIIGADEQRLVWNADAKRIGLDKTLIAPDRQPRAAAALATVVGIDADSFVDKVAAYGPLAFVEAAVIRASGGTEWRTLAAASRLDGVRMLDAVRPLALSGSFARGVLGTVGEATADIIRASGGDIREGDLVGLGGLQKANDERLMGVTGFVVQAYPDGHSEQARDLFTVPAMPGESLRTTLDVRLQRRAEALLAQSPGRAAAVLIRPSDGAVLAVASDSGGTTATTRRVVPDTFLPVTGLTSGEDQLDGALRALGLDGDAELGLPVFLASTDGRALRMSPLAMAAATASIARGSTVRPHLVVDREPAEVPDGITSGKAESIRAQLREQVAKAPLRQLSRLSGARVLADSDGRTWTVAIHGDLAAAVYHAEGGSVALMAALLRTAGA